MIIYSIIKKINTNMTLNIQLNEGISDDDNHAGTNNDDRNYHPDNRNDGYHYYYNNLNHLTHRKLIINFTVMENKQANEITNEVTDGYRYFYYNNSTQLAQRSHIVSGIAVETSYFNLRYGCRYRYN